MDEITRLLKKSQGKTIASNNWMVRFERFYCLFTLFQKLPQKGLIAMYEQWLGWKMIKPQIITIR
ncbi:hypothetical protein [Segetibacter aerophilus]|uniref:hypothetical protein n=1 Tax=Segetibacter aerophilus TaxID=670293 RepID=UPI0011BED331|nr:hypothetical protein [Segetibacter aerophilus]